MSKRRPDLLDTSRTRATDAPTAPVAARPSRQPCTHGATRRAVALLVDTGLAERSAARLPITPPPRVVGLWPGYDRRPRR